MKGNTDTVTFHLRYTPPFDWPFFVRYFQTRSTPGVEAVSDGRYTRSIVLDQARGVLCVAHEASRRRLAVTVHGDARHQAELIAPRVARMFDLAADMAAVHRVLMQDRALAPHVKRSPGIRVPGAWSAFEMLVRTIVGQQVSVKAASTIIGRIAERFGTPASPSGVSGLHFYFPTPRAVAEGDFSRIGMPAKRAEAVQHVARAIADGAIPFSDAGAFVAGVKEALLQQRGIGPWTAEYFALRALRDADAWPGTDLVLRRAMLPHPAAKLTPAALLALTAPWRPWRAYAAMHLWHNAT